MKNEGYGCMFELQNIKQARILSIILFWGVIPLPPPFQWIVESWEVYKYIQMLLMLISASMEL